MKSCTLSISVCITTYLVIQRQMAKYLNMKEKQTSLVFGYLEPLIKSMPDLTDLCIETPNFINIYNKSKDKYSNINDRNEGKIFQFHNIKLKKSSFINFPSNFPIICVIT